MYFWNVKIINYLTYISIRLSTLLRAWVYYISFTRIFLKGSWVLQLKSFSIKNEVSLRNGTSALIRPMLRTFHTKRVSLCSKDLLALLVGSLYSLRSWMRILFIRLRKITVISSLLHIVLVKTRRYFEVQKILDLGELCIAIWRFNTICDSYKCRLPIKAFLRRLCSTFKAALITRPYFSGTVEISKDLNVNPINSAQILKSVQVLPFRVSFMLRTISNPINLLLNLCQGPQVALVLDIVVNIPTYLSKLKGKASKWA